MNIKTVRKRVKRPVATFAERLKWLFKTSSHDSVYFYTFHKCASSLFSGYVLKNIEGLRHVDYARQIYRGKSPRLEFKETGHVYGPIRISVDRMSPVYETLVRPVTNEEFIRDKIAIFLVRDPRDILVSAYYSFGYTHGFSRVKEIRARQMTVRDDIQTKTVDDYALNSADVIQRNFEKVYKLSRVCKRSSILKYETMITDFDEFADLLTRHVNLKTTVVRQIFERSRPKTKIDTSSHRRSGKPGGFRSALKEDTVNVLNQKFEDTLEQFYYQM